MIELWWQWEKITNKRLNDSRCIFYKKDTFSNVGHSTYSLCIATSHALFTKSARWEKVFAWKSWFCTLFRNLWFWSVHCLSSGCYCQLGTPVIWESLELVVTVVMYPVSGSLRSSAIFLDKNSVLRLYKDLLRYSGRLVYTDKNYYLNRVRTEFRKNQSLSRTEDIHFYFNVRLHYLYTTNSN